MSARQIKIQAFLTNLPLFRQLDSAEIDHVAEGATEIDAPRGSILFRRGDPCSGFHIVIYGQVKLALQTPQGHERVVELAGPGQSFGEAMMFLGRPYMVTAETLADTKLLHVGRDMVFAEIDRDPVFARRMIAGLSQRLHRLIADFEMVTLHSGTQRVIDYLLRDAAENSKSPTLQVMLPAKKSIIASHLDLTPEHFSRILHELSAAGLIQVAGRNVAILDMARLRRHVG